jgi:hypothetical protein
MPLRAMRLSAAEHHIFDLGGIERRSLAQHILNAMRRQIIRARHIE